MGAEELRPTVPAKCFVTAFETEQYWNLASVRSYCEKHVFVDSNTMPRVKYLISSSREPSPY